MKSNNFHFEAEPFLTVYKTTAYNAFHILRGNRRINQVHLARLTESFKRKHLVTPVIVNKRMQIIDGQHRFTSARALGLPVYFIVLEDYALDEVQILNSNFKVYNKIDAIGGYCDLGNTHYIALRDFMAQFPEFGVGAVIQLLTARADGDTLGLIDEDGHKRNFKEGGFLVRNDIRKAILWATQLRDIGQYYKGYTRRAFISAMMSIFDNPQYDHQEFIRKLKAQPLMLSDVTTATQYRLMVEDLYNFKRRDKVNLRF